MICLPSLPGARTAGLQQMRALASERGLQRRFVVALLIFVGHFAAYTYLAPYVQEEAGITGQTLGILLFAFGLAAVGGNLVGGVLAARNSPSSVFVMTLMMFISISGLLMFVDHPLLLWPVIMFWGFAFGMIPITMQIWCFDASNGRIEGVQALLVCVINLSIGGGAVLGGQVSEYGGFVAAILTGAACAIFAISVVLLSLNMPPKRASEA